MALHDYLIVKEGRAEAPPERLLDPSYSFAGEPVPRGSSGVGRGRDRPAGRGRPSPVPGSRQAPVPPSAAARPGASATAPGRSRRGSSVDARGARAGRAAAAGFSDQVRRAAAAGGGRGRGRGGGVVPRSRTVGASPFLYPRAPRGLAGRASFSFRVAGSTRIKRSPGLAGSVAGKRVSRAGGGGGGCSAPPAERSERSAGAPWR